MLPDEWKAYVNKIISETTLEDLRRTSVPLDSIDDLAKRAAERANRLQKESVDLDKDSRTVLFENLWDLYD